MDFDEWLNSKGVKNTGMRRRSSSHRLASESASKAVTPSQIRAEYGPYLVTPFGSPPTIEHLFGTEGLGAFCFVLMVGIPIIYGAFHLLGWHTQFPTTTERLLWRIATVGVASSGAAIFFPIFPIFLIPAAVLYWKGSLSKKSEKILRVFFHLVVFRLIPFLYMIGSTYLFVESIRQLWYLPPDAFVVASWTYYFPHPF